MNRKKSLVDKKNVVNILSLILGGVDNNKEISKVLGIKQSTISEHLSPLKKEGLVFVWKTEKYNIKRYSVETDKVAELFFRLYLKSPDLVRFKDNGFVTLTFAGIIGMKEGLLKIDPLRFDKIDLAEIFSEAYDYFYYRGKYLIEGNEKIALGGYTAKENKEEIESEFKEFLKLIHAKRKRATEESKQKEEAEIIEKGKKLVKQISI